MLKPKGILTSDCIITSCWILPLLSFLGKVYGELRSLDSFFVWCVGWNKILMGDNLRLRGLDFVDWCIMRRHYRETVDHLFLHCKMAVQLWIFAFITFGVLWVIPRLIPDMLFGQWNWLGKHLSQIWN